MKRLHIFTKKTYGGYEVTARFHRRNGSSRTYMADGRNATRLNDLISHKRSVIEVGENGIEVMVFFDLDDYGIIESRS